MLYLGEKDIKALVSFEELMDRIELAFRIYREKNFQMPDRIHLHRGKDTVLYMPCFIDSMIGTKIVTVFPDNNKKSLPIVEGIMLLNDVETGKPVAIIDGAKLTAYRTGAVGGIGIKYTARENCEAVGLIGAGVQGFFQLLFAARARNIKRIYVYDIFKEKLQTFKERLKKELPDIEIIIARDTKELVEGSEIIITATTSNSPVLPDNEDMLRGKHIIAIGSYKPEMRELPEALYRVLDEVYIDTEFAAEESGDIITPLKSNWIKRQQLKTFSELLGERQNRACAKGKATLFKCVGMALFDLVVSEFIYKKAVKEKAGQIIST